MKHSTQAKQFLLPLTGVSFYSEVGAFLAGKSGTEETESIWKMAREMKLDAVRLKSSEVRKTFPYMYFEDQQNAVHVKSNAGCINPRDLVLAEQEIATSQVRLSKRAMKPDAFIQRHPKPSLLLSTLYIGSIVHETTTQKALFSSYQM